MAITVRTQAELDKALKAKESVIYIESDAGVWLRVTDSGSSSVVAWGSSRVEAWGSSRVVAWGSSRVVARDSSSVVAWGSSSVVAWGSSRVVAWGSSRVVAWGSSSVVAWGSSRVEASGSSRVVARDSSSVVARDSSSVEASRYVAIHLHSKRVTINGNGHLIDVTDIDTKTVEDFIDYHGVRVEDGQAVLYKAVDQDLNAGQHHTLTRYPIGETVTAPDWDPRNQCGGGLHFGYRPAVARGYYNGDTEPRFLEVHVPVEGLVALGDKAKAKACFVAREVDIHGEPK